MTARADDRPSFVRVLTPVLIMTGLSAPLLTGSPLSAQTPTGAIVGTVTERDGERPLEGAQVVLLESETGIVTDRRGRFYLADVPAGRHTLRVRYIGFESGEEAVEVGPGETVRVGLVLDREAVPLPELEVRVRGRATGRMAGFYQRMAIGSGHYITREDLESAGTRRLSDAFRRVPNVRVERCMIGNMPITGCYRLLSGRRVRSFVGEGGACEPEYFLDGTRFPLTNMGIDQFAPADIEGIEVYRGAAELPVEYATSRSACGVVLIWTRRGGR